MKSAIEFEWRGFAELQASFAALPEELANEANAFAMQHAQDAEAVVRAAYDPHNRTGEMSANLRIESIAVGPYTRAAVLVDTSSHALWFELGTAARHTRKGYNRGAIVRPANVFIPAMQRARKRFYDDVTALLMRHGLTVLRAA